MDALISESPSGVGRFKNEGLGQHRLQDYQVSNDLQFGVELELFFPRHITQGDVQMKLDEIFTVSTERWKSVQDSRACQPLT